MGFLAQMFGLERDGAAAGGVPVAPVRAGAMAMNIERSITSSADLDEALRRGNVGASGQAVTSATALRAATVFACVRRRTGAIANTPVGIKRRVDDRTREDATDHPAWMVFNRKPNRWQTPSQFKRMMEAHVQLRGNAYAFMGRDSRGRVSSLTPLNPDRVEVKQLDDLSLVYKYTRPDGRQTLFTQDEIFRVMGLSLDGVTGLSVLAYAREAIGLSLAQDQHGAAVFRNGANMTGAFSLPEGRTLSETQIASLRAQLNDFRQGGAREASAIVLEDGMKYQQMGLSAQDAEWIEARKFSRTDICMFFDVPPHMIGITDGNTQLGSSIEQQTQGYVTFSLEDSFVGWEEAIGLHCLDWVNNPELYARFNRNALVRGDIKTRWAAYVSAMQWGVKSPNDVLADEDENPRPGGDIYYPPPNMTAADQGGQSNVNP